MEPHSQAFLQLRIRKIMPLPNQKALKQGNLLVTLGPATWPFQSVLEQHWNRRPVHKRINFAQDIFIPIRRALSQLKTSIKRPMWSSKRYKIWQREGNTNCAEVFIGDVVQEGTCYVILYLIYEQEAQQRSTWRKYASRDSFHHACREKCLYCASRFSPKAKARRNWFFKRPVILNCQMTPQG